MTEWFMVPLSKSGLRLIRSVGSNPTLSAERCWSGLTGTPGERVSGFPRPWVRIPPSPPMTGAGDAPERRGAPFRFTSQSLEFSCGLRSFRYPERTCPQLSSSKRDRLQKAMILYRLIWVRDSILLAVADLTGFFVRSRESTPVLVK